MSKRKRPGKVHRCISHANNFFLQTSFIKFSLIPPAHPHFLEFITRKYGIFDQGQKKFPPMVFLLRKHFLFSREYYLNPQLFFDVKLFPQISLNFAQKRGEKVNALGGSGSNSIYPEMCRSKYFVNPVDKTGIKCFGDTKNPTVLKVKDRALKTTFFTHPEAYLRRNIYKTAQGTPVISPGHRMVTQDRGKEDKVSGEASPLEYRSKSNSLFARSGIDLSSYKTYSAMVTQVMLPRAPGMNIIVKPDWPRPASPGIASVPPEFHHAETERTFKINPPSFYQSAHISWEKGQSDYKSEAGVKKFGTPTDFEHFLTESLMHPLPIGPAPVLYYLNPLKDKLDEVKNSVADIEKKMAEDKSRFNRSHPENSHVKPIAPGSIEKNNINLSHLTDQVYSMLERRIRIEKETRGL